MARVNIEDSFFLIVDEVADEIGLRPWALLGHVAFLWNRSQRKFKTSGSAQEIKRWSRVEDSMLENFISVLCDFDLLRKISEDEFLIVGNKKHVKNLKSLEKSKKIGGKTRAKDAERDSKGRLKKSPASVQQTSSTTPASDPADIQQDPAQYNTMQLQFNSMQDNTRQSKTELSICPAKSEPEKPKLLKTEISQVWTAYKDAFIVRYNQEPPYSAKNYALCGNIIKRIGLTDALKVVVFYLTHNDQWYVKKTHAIDYCAKDCEPLLTQMRANFKVTSSFAQQQDRSQNNQQVFQEVLELWNAKEEAQDDAAGT